MGDMELCRRRTAATGRTPMSRSYGAEHTPTRLALTFLYELSGELEEDPVVFQSREDRKLTILFRGACCRCGDLLVAHGGILARISSHWRVMLCGTVGGTEVGEVSVWMEEAELCWRQSNVSGRPFEELSDLCVNLWVETEQELDFLAEVLARMSFQACCIAISRRYETTCLNNHLAKPSDGARFCYLPMLDEVEPDEALESLSIEQKAELWSGFLENGLPAREFEWVWTACRQGDAVGLLEWELALRLALNQNKIQIVNTENQFCVSDESGKVLRFNAASSNAAERLFLKILFPAVPGT